MKKENFFSTLVKGISIVCILTGAGFSFVWMKDYLRIQKNNEQAGLTYARIQTEAVVKYVDQEMLKQKRSAEALAKQLETASLEEKNLHALLQSVIERRPDLHGAVVAFVPNAIPGVERYAPFYHLLASGERDITQVESVYDYTDSKVPAALWYTQTAKDQKAHWYSIYGKASDDWTIIYAVPFCRTDSKSGKCVFSGVSAVTHSINTTFHQFFQYIPLGQEGYAVLMDDNNKVVFHPKREFIGLSLSQVAGLMNDTKLKEAGEQLRSRKSLEIERVAANGFLTWTIFKQLPSSEWYVAVIIRQDVKAMPQDEKIRRLINIGLSMMILLVGLTALIFQPEKLTNMGIWGFSISLGILALLGIAWIWYLIYTNPVEYSNTQALVNQKNISTYLKPFEDSDLANARGAPIRIPTGIVIENLSVTNTSAALSGYVWQKFPAQIDPDNIQPPQFVNETSETSTREIYRFIQNGKRVIGWFFNAELREYFDVTRYPLDEMTIKLEIEPGNLGENAILVPDIDSYEYMSPSTMPGLPTTISLPGWNLQSSYFTFGTDHFNADFGSALNVYKNDYPSLVFNIHGTRNIVSPLIAYCIIIAVLLVQIFGIVMIQIDEPFEVLSVGAALFLVNAISHNALRGELAVSHTIYLEYFFIFLYVIILASSINGLARTLKVKLKILENRDNILAKALFWPLYLGAGFILTLITFYP